MAKAKKARTSQDIPSGIRTRVVDVMDSLGGDDFAYYNIDPKSIRVGTAKAKIKYYMKVLVAKSNRDLATSQVAGELKKKDIGHIVSGNTIDVSVSDGDLSAGIIRLDIKPSGGGSGAGAAETAKNEAGQALFCALRWSRTSHLTKENWSQENLESVLSNCDLKATGKNLTVNTLLQVAPIWIESHVKGANLLYEKYANASKTYGFHRGSSLVSRIEDVWKKCNKASDSYFSDINKWSPADIYLVSNDFVGKGIEDLETSSTLEVLNAKMSQYFKSGDLIGVSLKKIESGNGSHSVKNDPGKLKDTSAVSYKGFDSNFDSIDLYVQWGSGPKDKIQFRNTAGDKKQQWQGEIKGLSAAQGKIGGGVVDGILRRLKFGDLGIKTNHQGVKNLTHPDSRNGKDVTKDIFNGSKNYNLPGFKDNKQTLTDIAYKSHSWRYSNYINLKLLDIITGLNKDDQDKLIQAFYFYAASQSGLSAIYAKIE